MSSKAPRDQKRIYNPRASADKEELLEYARSRIGRTIHTDVRPLSANGQWAPFSGQLYEDRGSFFLRAPAGGDLDCPWGVDGFLYRNFGTAEPVVPASRPTSPAVEAAVEAVAALEEQAHEQAEELANHKEVIRDVHAQAQEAVQQSLMYTNEKCAALEERLREASKRAEQQAQQQNTLLEQLVVQVRELSASRQRDSISPAPAQPALVSFSDATSSHGKQTLFIAQAAQQQLAAATRSL